MSHLSATKLLSTLMGYLLLSFKTWASRMLWHGAMPSYIAAANAPEVLEGTLLSGYPVEVWILPVFPAQSLFLH